MIDYKGTVLQFREFDYNKTVISFGPLLEAVDKVGRAYEDLDTTLKFDQEAFEDIVRTGVSKVKIKYQQLIEDQIKASKFTSKAIIQTMRENVETEIEKLLVEVEKMKEVQLKAVSTQAEYPVDFEFIEIQDGKAALTEKTKQAIKERFIIRIDSEDQNSLYNHLVELQIKYAELVAFLTAAGVDLQAMGDLIDDKNNGLCYEDRGRIIIDPYSVTIKLKSNVGTSQ